MELSANSPHHLSREKKKVEFQLEALQVKKKKKTFVFVTYTVSFFFCIRLHFICTLDLFTLFFLSQTKMQV